MRVIAAAVFVDVVSARLGTSEESQEMMVPSYFGEAAVTPTSVNAMGPEAERTEAPRPHILLAQSSLQSVGITLKQDVAAQAEAQPPAAQPAAVQPPVAQQPQAPSVEHADDDLENVCERTQKALSAQVTGSAMPSGPVYKECMAALAPLRVHQQDSDAVDTLSDCMALVNALVANKGGDCQNAVAVLRADKAAQKAPTQQPPAQQPVAPVQKKPQPTVVAKPPVVQAAAQKVTIRQPQGMSKEAIAQQQQRALDLVSEAMNEVCTETVRDAEVGIKSEGDAMKLANAVAPLCEENAKKHLGGQASASALTREWCRQLDGRLTIALETGFYFALSPDEAERQAAESNPYAAETRRKFCGRFVNSLRKQAQEGALYLKGPAPVKPAAPVVETVAAQPQDLVPLPTIPPAPKAPVVEAVAAPPPPAAKISPPVAAEVFAKSVPVPVQSAARGVSSKPVMPMAPFGTPVATPKNSGTDMLRLVQALSSRNEWNEACTGLISRLTSEEGSVTEEYALGGQETPEGTKVLTFNAQDQGQIRKCAAQLKVLAIQTGVPPSAPDSGMAQKGASFIELSSADDAEALMDSPWAADACSDIAHGYLTARLAHPGLEVAEFCPLYAHDLHAMRSGVLPAERAKQEIQQLRKRGKRLVAQQQTQVAATPKPALRAASPPAAPEKRAVLITQSTNVEEKEGMDFWQGLLQ
jgi:hypothetical protein